MKTSNSFRKQLDKKNESDNELPREWDYLSKRLEEVQKGLTILEKKHFKIQKRLSTHIDSISQLNSQLAQQVLIIKSNLISKLEIKDNINKQIETIKSQLSTSFEQQIANFKDSFDLQLEDKLQIISLKVRTVYDQSKAYIDRVIFQFKELLRIHLKQQAEITSKNSVSSRENSPSFLPKSGLNKSKSAKKIFQNSQKPFRQERQAQQNNNWTEKSRENSNKQSLGNSNRVSYLRQKLKEFQKVNKKYQAEVDKVPKQQKTDVMQKMRNYRQFLQQSQSQLQPSKILNSEDISSFSSVKKKFSIF